MCAMLRIGRSAAASGLTGAVLVLTGGCGGLPTVIPAGSAGLEIPPDSAASQASAASGAKAGTGGAPTAARSAPAAVAPSGTGPALRAAGVGSAKPGSAKSAPQRQLRTRAGAAEVGAGAGAPRTPRASGTQASATAGKGAGLRAAALPPTGTYAYALTGTSSLGPPPETSTITVADAGGGTQLWTLDSRRADGAGMVEELTLSHATGLTGAGVYISAYRLDASSGFAGVILEFSPTSPVMLTPTAARAGTRWTFDLGTSADGCATAKGFGEVLDDATATSVRRFRQTTTVHTVGPALCVPIEGERTQEIRHPAHSLLPTQIDSDLRGTVGGAPFTATTTAIRPERSPTASATGRVQAPHPAVVADRARP